MERIIFSFWVTNINHIRFEKRKVFDLNYGYIELSQLLEWDIHQLQDLITNNTMITLIKLVSIQNSKT